MLAACVQHALQLQLAELALADDVLRQAVKTGGRTWTAAGSVLQTHRAHMLSCADLRLVGLGGMQGAHLDIVSPHALPCRTAPL